MVKCLTQRGGDVTLSLGEIDEMLNRGRLMAIMNTGKLWKIRRNGATKTWKTRPNEFRIPIKAGLKACGEITQDAVFAQHDAFFGRTDVHFVIKG